MQSAKIFVATCSMVAVVAVGQTSLFYCEHHSRHSHPGRSFISQFLQIGAASAMQDFVGLAARSGAGGEMIINPVS